MKASSLTLSFLTFLSPTLLYIRKNSVLVVGTSRVSTVIKSSSRRYIALNFFFSLFGRSCPRSVLSKSRPSHQHSPSISSSIFDAAEPPFTPSRCCLSVAIPVRFTTYPLLSLFLPFLGTIPSFFQHLVKSHNSSGQRCRQERQQPDLSYCIRPKTRGSRNGGVPLPSADFCAIMQGTFPPALASGCQLQLTLTPCAR